MARIEPYLLNLAGEYRICSELNKRNVFATVTYGTRKSADVYAISDRRRRALKIEVKTSQRSRFVTSITQRRLRKDPIAPDFWVLVQIQPKGANEFRDRFFILTHQEICNIQTNRNRAYARRNRATHRRAPNFARGVDNITVADVERHENKWSKILAKVGASAPARGSS